jgi:cysteine-rich repeat protein
VCGDGEIDAGESCDDVNLLDGDGCSATCQSEATCGNSRPDAGEQCDDGNQNNGDGCSIDCLIEVTEVYEAMDSFSGSISSSDDSFTSSFHEYRITVDAPSVFTAYTSPSAVCDTNDTVLTVYALNELNERVGEALIENDDEDEVSLCSFIDAFNLEQGRYAVVVSGFGAIDAYTLDLMLTRDASTTGDYLGLMQDVGSDGFDIDVAATSDLTAYITVDGNCVIGSNLSLYGADLDNPIAGPANFVVLESGCEGIRLDDLASDLYYLELRSDELQQREYVLHLSVEESVEPNPVDYCELKWPDNLGPVAQGYETEGVYAQVYEAGVTDITTGVDPSALVQAQIGYGPSTEEPMTGENWMWTEAAPNANYGPDSAGYAENNDEYTATLTAPASGIYAFVARFTVDAGQTWTVCDFDGSNNGYQADAAGRLTVARAPTQGELLITEILYDSNLAGDVAGEWFEVQNTTGEVLSLVGLTLTDEGTDSINLDVLGPWDSGALIQPGAFAVFARESDTASNGGVTPDYTYGNEVGLANDSDELILSNGSGIIDQVNWTGRTIFDVNGSAVGANIDPVGASISLSGDGSGTWCEGVGEYGDGGQGTPGAANPICDCVDGTFDHDDNPLTACQTCDVCGDGTVESAACTPTSNTQCAACPDGACDCAEGTFDHDDNPLTACQSCDACSAGEVETVACTPTRNTECEVCAVDTVDHDEDPTTACQACDVCADGEVETASCTSTRNTQCEACGEGTFDDDNDPLTLCQACDVCGDDEIETASCTPTSNTQCEAIVSGWTEADARSKVSMSCAGCHGAGSHSSWSLGLIYSKVRVDFAGRNRMPKGNNTGGFWSDEDIEKLRVLIEDN